MRLRPSSILVPLCLALNPFAWCQSGPMHLPAKVTAGSAFSISTSGSGAAELYIVGPGQALRRRVQLGSTISIPAGVLYHAGRYLAVLSGAASAIDQLEVIPSTHPSSISFLAEPSRLPVNRHDAISGTAYLFDAWRNLIVQPLPVSFRLTDTAGATQSRTATTQDGVAWTRMNSSPRQGSAKFVAAADRISVRRIIDEVPGNPCNLTITAKPAGVDIAVATAPVRDCSGNPVPDGTIVTFTETLHGRQSTADVPLKKDIASIDMPAWNGATISVASGVVAGNQITWENRQ